MTYLSNIHSRMAAALHPSSKGNYYCIGGSCEIFGTTKHS